MFARILTKVLTIAALTESAFAQNPSSYYFDYSALEVLAQDPLIRLPVVPNPGLPQEVEARPLYSFVRAMEQNYRGLRGRVHGVH